MRSPHPVGETLANPWGLYDLYGNVLETCLDRFVKADTMPETSVTEPAGPLFTADNACVQRGGAYNWVNSQSRSGYREWCGYSWGGDERGFRLWAPVE